jgi:hypothetical protein
VIEALSQATVVPSGKAHALRSLIEDGFPVLPQFLISKSLFDLHLQGASAREEPMPLPEPEGKDDIERLLEIAVAREWRMLATPLAAEIEAQILDWVADLSTPFLLVRSLAGETLSTHVARGRFHAIQAVHEAWASCYFHQLVDSTEPILLATAIPGDPRDLFPIPPDDAARAAPWVARLADRGIPRSLWLATDSGPRIADAGGTTADPADPWGLADAEREWTAATAGGAVLRPEQPLYPRVLLGRVYNRLVRPSGPSHWLPLLMDASAGTDAESLFLTACAAIQPGAGERLLALARESVGVEMRQSGRHSTPSDRDLSAAEVPTARQLMGHCGNRGEARGPVHYAGRPASRKGYVLVCDRLGSDGRDLLDGAVAVVERRGSCFGIGSLMSRERGLPHLYGVADASLLPEGAPVVVDAGLRLVTMK